MARYSYRSGWVHVGRCSPVVCGSIGRMAGYRHTEPATLCSVELCAGLWYHGVAARDAGTNQQERRYKAMEASCTNSRYAHRLYRVYRIALCLVVIGSAQLAVGQQYPASADTQRIALQQIFGREVGHDDKETIARYLAYTDLGYGHEWCAAFVSYCFGALGRTAPKTPWSPSLFPSRKLVWHRAYQKEQPGTLLPGMVWGIYVSGKKRVGHVGFVDSYRGGIVSTVEGNTGHPRRAGPNGVYRKRRAWRTIYCVADWI